MSPEELFSLANQPLPGHHFKDISARVCNACSGQAKMGSTRIPPIVAQLKLLRACDKRVIEAAEYIFSLKEKDMELPSSSPYFTFVKQFCNGWPNDDGSLRVYQSSVWAGKARMHHALHAYWMSLVAK